jgi:nucleosome binding factor SPN SPT16 subunit
LEFDIPFKELMFSGCHSKACVNMYPTSTSLVSLQEPPFFATSVKDIELVHFERVSLAVKNFDFVMVYKDYANFKRISSVPMESLMMIKEWLDESDIIYTEGPISLNWLTILAQIRSDIGGFIEQGGWSFLAQNGADSDSEDSVNSDSNFDEDEKQSSEDDYSGSEEESDDGDSSDVHTGSEDTEGMDWDEMER